MLSDFIVGCICTTYQETFVCVVHIAAKSVLEEGRELAGQEREIKRREETSVFKW